MTVEKNRFPVTLCIGVLAGLAAAVAAFFLLRAFLITLFFRMIQWVAQLF